MGIYSGCPRAQQKSKDSFQKQTKKRVKRIQVQFPALHQERSKWPAHSPPTVTHAHCWQQLGTGPTDSAARPKMNKNLAGASLLVSLHWYIKPEDKRQHQVPCGISQQGSSPISNLRDCGDLYLWICFSIHFPFNDAEERSVSTKEDVSVTWHCSGSWQQSGCCLELAGKISVIGFVVGFLRKEKTAGTDNWFNSEHTMPSRNKCSQRFLSKTCNFPNVLLESAFSCMAIPCIPGTSVAWTWRWTPSLLRSPCGTLGLQYPMGDVSQGNTAHKVWSTLSVSKSHRMDEVGGASGPVHGQSRVSHSGFLRAVSS